MVNLDKWEEIEYGKIKRHDLIRCITVQGDATNDACGIVDRYDSLGVYNKVGVNFVVDPYYFEPAGGGHRTIYRRKPEPFVFPIKRLAIIKGQRIGHDEVFINFVKTDSRWYHQSGSDYKEASIRSFFHNFEVIFEGIDD